MKIKRLENAVVIIKRNHQQPTKTILKLDQTPNSTFCVLDEAILYFLYER